MSKKYHTRAFLPEDVDRARLLGRAWVPASIKGGEEGPLLITVDSNNVYALEGSPFCSEMINGGGIAGAIDAAKEGPPFCSVEDLIANSLGRSDKCPRLLSPVDLQAIKAAGVTFAVSLIERLVEERAEGDPARAAELRNEISEIVGSDLSKIRPGTKAAEELSRHLKEAGMWSQYLEVGIGPYAEVFTKSQPLSSVGFGAQIGLHPDSQWNNPEPEAVLVVNARQEIIGVTLGNDVNLRDIEGRSALLLGRAKDNNASCALGPFIRLLDDGFSLDDVRKLRVQIRVEGDDGFVLDAGSNMAEISRDIEDLVQQCSGATHQYPDGFVLMTGTLFAPVQDRAESGKGFSHFEGDHVEISSPRLGALVNQVTRSDKAPPWTFGFAALVKNYQSRGLL